MPPKRRVCGRAYSSSGSVNFFSADDQSEVLGNSTLSSSYGNSSNGNGHGSLGLFYGGDGNGNCAVLNIADNSGPSVGASSLITDANSGLSGGPHLQRSVSFSNNNNTESYMRLPASPMSFSSNLRSVSGSPIMDGSSFVQQNQEPISQHSDQSQQHQGPSQLGQLQLTNNRFASSFTQDPTYNSPQLQKKPRLDIEQEGGGRQNLLHPFSNGQDSLHSQSTRHLQLQALIQQQKFHQLQEILRSMPPQQREILRSLSPQQQAQLLEQHQLALRRQGGLQQPSSVLKQSFDNNGVCSRLVKQYLRHKRQRPTENTLAHWKEFVALYYAPQAKQRWCFSLYNNNNVGRHSHGVFPHVTLDATHCHLCGSKSGKGFVATYESLPRLYDIKYANGLIDEFLFLDLPGEANSPSGEIILEYGKAVLESVYEKFRVLHDGKLRIIFSNFKILSWEFCAHHHEEYIPRRLVAPQVNQLIEVAQKCQSTEKVPNAISHQNLQANCNMFATVASQFARSLDSKSINDLGFNRRYVQCLQIAEVAYGMTDLMDICIDKKIGPIDALKEFNGATSQPRNMQKMYNCDEVTPFNKSEQSSRRIPVNSDHGGGAPPQVAAPPPDVNKCNNPNQTTSSAYNNQEMGNGFETVNMFLSRDGTETETGLENDVNPIIIIATNNVETSPNMKSNSLKTESNQCLNNVGFNQEPVEPEPETAESDNLLIESTAMGFLDDIHIDDYII